MEPEPTVENSVRLFIAITIPDDVKAAIEVGQKQLQAGLPRARVAWTRREQLHLTLKFLGDVEVARVGELTAAVKSACASYTPLQLRGTALGVFPDKRFPRVIWIGVREAQGKLAGLQTEIAKSVQPFAKPEPEKEFTGHVTIARIKQIDRAEAGILSQAFQRLGECVTREWTADKIVIMRSELLPGGACHTLIEAISLSAPI